MPAPRVLALPSVARLVARVGVAPRVPAPGPTRRRARSAVVGGAVLFVGVQAALGYAIHTERSPLRDPLYFDKVKLFRGHPAFLPGPDAAADAPVTVLLVGSSRTLNAADAGAAARRLSAALGRPADVFNFAQAGAGPVTNAVYVRRLQKDGVRPDFALIEVHPVFLAGQRPDPPEARWLLPFRLRPDELPLVRGLGFPAATPATHGPRGFLAPFAEYRFLLLDRYAPVLLMNNSRLNGGHEPDANGFARLQPAVAPTERAYFMGLARGQYADYFAGYRPTGPGVAAVRDTLEQCRAAGWKAGLILMPECAGWREWYDPAGLKELDALLAGLGAEYGVPVFDARAWVPDDLTVDGHHLTGPGADLFTEKLVRDALAPWLARELATPRPAP